MHRYHIGRGHMPHRLTALFLATTMTVGVVPSAFAAEMRRDIQNSDVQSSSPVETIFVNSYEGTQREINFNDHWKFNLGDAADADKPAFNDASWENVDLPHDYSIDQKYTTSGEAESGFLPGGIGWYRKSFTLDPSWKTQKRVSIHFDGVYMNAEVYLNGHKLGEHPYGYTAFSFELPEKYLSDGENILSVKVNNKIPSSRWYSGSGIYRDVTLVVTDRVHVAPNGVTVTTPNIAQNKGTVKIRTEIANDSNADVNDLTVVNTVLKKGEETSSLNASKTVNTLTKGETTVVESEVEVSKPELWNVWDKGAQNLYIVRTEVKKGGETIDTYDTEFGFRYTKFDTDTGFHLNGEQIKLRGVCMHHDQGALGSEAWRRAIERQVDILKEMGCNAIRVTHNPAAESLIEICNEKGMLVIDEAFDTWTRPKNGNSNDYARHFNTVIAEGNDIEGKTAGMTWAEFDVKSMVSRGKNDPSIIMWSLGNEIFEGVDDANRTTDYPEIAGKLIDWVDEADGTRPTTFGQNNNHGPSGNDIAMKVAPVFHEKNGVIGLNYASEDKMSTWKSKGWKVYGSETASAINSRGVYEDKTAGMQQTPNQMLTSYDKSKVNWGAVASDAWWRTIRYDYNAGEFVWTGFDYLGEPTPWNNIGPGSTTGANFDVSPKSSYFGIIDTTGFPKDSYYLYQSLWNDKLHTLHVLPTWDEKDVKIENGKVEVVVYSDAPVIKLYLDGEEVGAAEAESHKSMTASGQDENGAYTYQTYKEGQMTGGKTNTFQAKQGHESLYATFLVPYKAGKLTAKAFDKSGQEITDQKFDGRSTVETTEGQKKLNVSADRQTITADGKDLSYITIDVQDAKGRFVNGAEPEISVEVTGEGKLLALDNGKQADHTPYKDSSRSATRGKLLAIVQSTNKSGEFTVTAKAAGLDTGSVTVMTKSNESGSPEAQDKIVSLECSKNYYVKLGNDPTLPNELHVNYSSGKKDTKPVTWNTDDLHTENKGLYRIPGRVALDKDQYLDISINVTMMEDVILLKNYSAAVAKDAADVNLPQVLPAITADGKISEASFAVEWDKKDLDLTEVGTYVLTGTAQVFGKEMHPTATIRVSKGDVLPGSNVASASVELYHNDKSQTDELRMIRDGKKSESDTVWNGQGSIKFRYDTAQNMAKVKLYMKENAPETSVQWSPDGSSWQDLQGKVEEEKTGGVTVRTYAFDLVSAVWMKVDFKGAVQLLESELITGIPNFTVGSADKLSELKVGRHTAPQGALDHYRFGVPETGLTEKDVTAVGKDNASVTILPAIQDQIRILTESEDHTRKGEYIIQLGDENGNPPSPDDPSFDYDRTKMKATAASWNEPHNSDGPPSYAIDGDENNWWHSRWGEGQGETDLSAHPDDRYIELKLDTPAKLNALRYLPRKGPDRNGIVTRYRVDVSTDGQSWHSIAKGEWEKNGDWKIAVFDQAEEVQYIRLYGEETSPGNKHMSAAEVRVCVVQTEDVDDQVQSYDPVTIRIEAGQKPDLPKQVKGRLASGKEKSFDVTWEPIDPQMCTQIGEFTVNGSVDGQSLQPKATIIVRGIRRVEPVTVIAFEGIQPQLPETVKVYFSDGMAEDRSVSWDTVDSLHGEVTVKGSVKDCELPACATVRFVEGAAGKTNIAENQKATGLPLAISWYSAGDNPFNATDGKTEFVSNGNKKIWSDWEQGVYHTDQNWMGVILGSGDRIMPQTVSRVAVGFMEEDGEQKNKVKLPDAYKIEYYTGPAAFDYHADQNGKVRDWTEKNPLRDPDNWTEVTYQEKPDVPELADEAFKEMVDVTFEPITTQAIRISLTPQNEQWVGLEEFEVYGLEPKEELLSTFTVEEITIDGENHLQSFDENKRLTVKLTEGQPIPTVEVKATNRAFVDIKQATPQDLCATAVITPENADVQKREIYEIRFEWEHTAKHTVRFESNGGTEIAPIIVESGHRITEPKEPARSGYVFRGWYVDEELETRFDFDLEITKDITLYAAWKREETHHNRPNKPSKPDKPEPKPTVPEEKPETTAPKVDIIPTVPGNVESIKGYDDMKSHWAQEAVSWAVTNKLFTGITETQFAPNTPMTRGMLVTVLHRLAGLPTIGQNQFIDIPAEAYYKDAVAWASQLGLVSGIGEGKFAPNNKITREQLAVILYKFAGSPAVAGQDVIFTDTDSVSVWAKDAVAWAVNEGFLSGMSDGALAPAGQATRAQVATILMRFDEKNHRTMESQNPLTAGLTI